MKLTGDRVGQVVDEKKQGKGLKKVDCVKQKRLKMRLFETPMMEKNLKTERDDCRVLTTASKGLTLLVTMSSKDKVQCRVEDNGRQFKSQLGHILGNQSKKSFNFLPRIVPVPPPPFICC